MKFTGYTQHKGIQYLFPVTYLSIIKKEEGEGWKGETRKKKEKNERKELVQ